MRWRHWQPTGLWQRIHHHLLRELKRGRRLKRETAIIESVHVRVFGGGDRNGPSPVGRRKQGTKNTSLVDACGTPLAI